jgi:hypothetical protein
MNTLPAGYRLSKNANRFNASYATFINFGWTREQMIQEGMIELIHPKKTVADVWEYHKGVWPENRNYIYWYSYAPFHTSEPICNRQDFEAYGRNRKVQADKTANAMVEKFEEVKLKWEEGEHLLDARQLSKAGNIALAARTGTNAVDQFAKQFKAMEKIRADILQEKATSELTERDAIIVQGNTAVVIDWKTCKVKPALSLNNQKLKTLQTELNKSRETNNYVKKGIRMHQRIFKAHKAKVNELTCERNVLQNALDKVRVDNDMARNETRLQRSVIRQQREDLNDDQEVINEQKAIIARLHEQYEKSIKANDHLRYMEKQQSKELKKQELSHIVKNTTIKQLQTELDKVCKQLGIGNRNQALEIRELNIVVREQVIEIRELGETVSSQANELDQLHSMYSEQAERCNEQKEPKNDD